MMLATVCLLLLERESHLIGQEKRLPLVGLCKIQLIWKNIDIVHIGPRAME